MTTIKITKLQCGGGVLLRFSEMKSRRFKLAMLLLTFVCWVGRFEKVYQR